MGTVRNLLQRFQAFDYDAARQAAVEETKDQIVVFVKQQLKSGYLSTGGRIRPYYATIQYAAKKFNMNRLPGFGTPDLLVTGDFYKGIGVVVTTTSFTTDSTDDKAPKLELAYTSYIYGLSPENLINYGQIVKPVLFEKIKNATVGG
jgi:hypothetical protein